LGWVLAAFCGLLLLQRWLGPRGGGSLPAGMVQVCGKVPLDAKQSLHLVRIGQRLLVLLESPQGMQRLAEITDPDEVRRLLQPHSATAQDFSPQPAARRSSRLGRGDNPGRDWIESRATAGKGN
jgi:flagellar biogenesis protein FliO